LCAKIEIPPIPVDRLAHAERSAIVAASQRASSMQGNPITLADETLVEILAQSVHPPNVPSE
jgi:hypothetical protein